MENDYDSKRAKLSLVTIQHTNKVTADAIISMDGLFSLLYFMRRIWSVCPVVF
jgi:hypothetical protein